MRTKSIVHRLFRIARRAAGLLTFHLRRYIYDRRYGVDTWKTVDLETLGIDNPNVKYGVAYEPTSKIKFDEMMRRLVIKHEDFTFIDLGCGKGKAMLLASEYPFKQIIGVEFSAELAAIASRNCQVYRSRRQKCRSFTVECMDAGDYRIPSNPTLIYMYNPFREQVMQAVLERIRHSLESHPREFHVMYYNPKLAELFRLSGFLQPVIEEENYCIYKGSAIRE